jgi:hypothetical protein
MAFEASMEQKKPMTGCVMGFAEIFKKTNQ